MDPIELSDSQIKTFQRCPRRWAYSKLLKLSADEDSDNLVFGNALHDSLEQYILTGSPEKGAEAAVKYVEENASQLSSPDVKNWQCIVAPAMFQGMAIHFFPDFIKEYEPVAVEEWFTSQADPYVKVRGYKDLKVRKRSTGKICLWDYKSSGSYGGGDLAKTVNFNNQLSRYAVNERRVFGEWPEEVGLIFAIKPRDEDPQAAAQKARTTSKNYFKTTVQVTPAFAQFALHVEQSDVLYGHQMLQMREAFLQQGPAALNYIPPNFDACFEYGTLCGFAKGCHSGHPAHQTLCRGNT